MFAFGERLFFIVWIYFLSLKNFVSSFATSLTSIGLATWAFMPCSKHLLTSSAKAVAVFGKLDIAYNNVGIHAAVREDLAETEGWDFDWVISVNLRGVWNCMKYELVEMKKHGKGAIVNCSSQGGLVGIPCIGAYNASKHGVLGLTKSAALEYARQGIRINAICPGTCETPMVRQAIEQSPDHMARVIDAIPLGRVGKAEEIASMVLLLCSDYAGFAIGQTWAMDGGYTAM